MTPDQVAVNDRAVREAAERLTATGWVGDSYRFVESLLLNAVASGWRRIEKPPALHGRGASREAIEAAKAAAEAAVRASREKRKKPATEKRDR